MQYSADPFYNENEKRVKFRVAVVCEDGEMEQKEVYASDITKATDIENYALDLLVAHEARLVKEAEKKTEAEIALAKVAIFVAALPEDKTITVERLEEHKAVLEAAKLEAEKQPKEEIIP